MQLGTRWAVGTTPPAAVPQELRAQLLAVEAALTAEGSAQPVPRWTLTWLEGRPVIELDTGITVTIDRSGAVVVRTDDEDEFD